VKQYFANIIFAENWQIINLYQNTVTTSRLENQVAHFQIHECALINNVSMWLGITNVATRGLRRKTMAPLSSIISQNFQTRRRSISNKQSVGIELLTVGPEVSGV